MRFYNAIFDENGVCYAITNKEINNYYKDWKSEYKNKEEFLKTFNVEKILKIEKDYIERFDGQAYLMTDLLDGVEMTIKWIKSKKNYRYEEVEEKIYYKDIEITDLILRS
jgi:hypothetical protein